MSIENAKGIYAYKIIFTIKKQYRDDAVEVVEFENMPMVDEVVNLLHNYSLKYGIKTSEISTKWVNLQDKKVFVKSLIEQDLKALTSLNLSIGRM